MQSNANKVSYASYLDDDDDDDDDVDYRLHSYAVNATGEAVFIYVFICNECSVYKKLILFSCIS